MTRAVVCVATTPYYQRGMVRLAKALADRDISLCDTSRFWGGLEAGWPSHSDVPYGFKGFALYQAASDGADLLLWADACMLPVTDMEPLWDRIERDGYWFSANGYTNYEWTADSAYSDLFTLQDLFGRPGPCNVRGLNREIPHVVATCFGLNVRHPKGRAFLDEYYRLASETRAFCGPWINSSNAEWLAQPGAQDRAMGNGRVGPCGPSDVRGHRHDQTAASVIAWRLGFQLTDPPEIFAYGKAGEPHDPRTILIADGSYQ